jgi:hypothetical protein
MKSLTIAALIVFALAAVVAEGEVVPCLYPDWKKTCQSECLKHGPNIQFNRCYNYNEADLMCKCNDKDMTSEILAMFKSKVPDTTTNTQSSQTTKSAKPEKTEQASKPAPNETESATTSAPKAGTAPAPSTDGACEDGA